MHNASSVCMVPAMQHSLFAKSMQAVDAPADAALLGAPSTPQVAQAMLVLPVRADVLLISCCALALWLLGVISGLLLPMALHRTASLWSRLVHSSSGADSAKTSAVAASGLQSRPLSDVAPEEVHDDVDSLMPHQHSVLHLVEPGIGSGVTPHWNLSKADLDRFRADVDPVRSRLLTGDLGPDGWNFIMDKEQPGRVRYASYWRPTPDGKTDYLSITIVNGTTAQEMSEFNMDDNSRVAWDPMLKKAWLLQSAKGVEDSCEQLVVYLRSFPMGFVSDRLYAGISRREFSDPSQPGCLWGVTKVVHTPVSAAWAALNYPGVTMTDDYFSAWECRTILSPWAASTDTAEPQPACAIILFHHDDLKVPEYLARTAIKLGMYKFVNSMVAYIQNKWLPQRRARVDPFLPDPQAPGRRPAPPLSPDVAAAAAAVAHRHTSSAVTLPTFDSASAGGGGGGGGLAAAAAVAAPASTATALSKPHGSWGGLQGLEQQQLQQLLNTPRVLVPVPTAPGPLSLMAQQQKLAAVRVGGSGSSAAGLLVPGSGELRRAHSLEFEPRLSSTATPSLSSNDDGGSEAATVVLVGGAGGGVNSSNNSAGAAVGNSGWQRLLQGAGGVVGKPVEWGGAVGGAVGGVLQHVGSTLQQVVGRGQNGQQAGGSATASSSSNSGVGGVSAAPDGRLAKPAAIRLLAPAGEDSDTATVSDTTAAAVSAAKAAAARIGSSLHTAEFGGSTSRPRSNDNNSLHKRLQKLFVAAVVAAAVGAGVAARHRGKQGSDERQARERATLTEQQQQPEQSVDQQQWLRRGLKPRVSSA